jgi:hypothetical protein
VFTPQAVDLPDVWPPCRRPQCGSTAAVARVEVPYGPVTMTCENGHQRGYRKKDDFRRGGRYAGLFDAAVVAPDVPGTARERSLEPGERRRAEVLEDAERCALCGTPPVEHPYRPDLDLRDDRELLAWLQRWRAPVFAQLCEAVTVAGGRDRFTFGDWRSRIPGWLREAVVGAIADSELRTDHLVPAVRLAELAGVLTGRELDFAVHRLLLPICRGCNAGRWRRRQSRDDYLREYVQAFYGGDERLARADAARWRTTEIVASHAAQLRLAIEGRPA